MTFNVYDYGREILSEDCVKLVKKIVGENNRELIPDCERMLVYFRRVSSPDFNETGRICADIRIIAESSLLDAERTEAIFWLAAVIAHYDLPKKIDPVHFKQITPNLMKFLFTTTKSTQLRYDRLKKMYDFIEMCTAEEKKLAAGDITPDEFAEKVLPQLPSPSAARIELPTHEKYQRTFERIEEITRLCADPSYYKEFSEYKEKLK